MSLNLAAAKRLRKELQNLERAKEPDPDIYLIPDGDNILRWTALLRGPSDTLGTEALEQEQGGLPLGSGQLPSVELKADGVSETVHHRTGSHLPGVPLRLSIF